MFRLGYASDTYMLETHSGCISSRQFPDYGEIWDVEQPLPNGKTPSIKIAHLEWSI